MSTFKITLPGQHAIYLVVVTVLVFLLDQRGVRFGPPGISYPASFRYSTGVSKCLRQCQYQCQWSHTAASKFTIFRFFFEGCYNENSPSRIIMRTASISIQNQANDDTALLSCLCKFLTWKNNGNISRRFSVKGVIFQLSYNRVQSDNIFVT